MIALDATLLVAVEDELRDVFGADARVLAAAPYAYATTHPCQEVTVLMNGATSKLLLKDLSPRAVLPEAVGARPEFLVDPGREVRIYLSPSIGGDLRPRCYAGVADPARAMWWVLLELVPASALWQYDDPDVWDAVVATLARLHAAGQRMRSDDPAVAGLLQHDRSFYEIWLERLANVGMTSGDGRLVELARRSSPIVDLLISLPRTVIHGEPYASNVLVGTGATVHLIDWEMVAWGAAATDVAAVVSGWDEDNVQRMAAAYLAAARRIGGWAPPAAEFAAGLDVCRLQQCLQWLAWSDGWIAPEEHRHDWFDEAVGLLDRLGL